MKTQRRKIGILVEQDYQDLEVWYPALRLREEGWETCFVGSGTTDGYTGKYGYPVEVDRAIHDARVDDFDAIVIPGGWAPDLMRREPRFAQFVREFSGSGKPVACICHGGWILISAGILKGRRATSFSGIQDDMINAGCHWRDEEVVVDGNLITSRKPEDLPAFCRELITMLKSQPGAGVAR
ncbi:MAG: type 1 glutamine amidotransferase [Armatimonadetes bacterium]|nr:type 1 glutamine amidotransferase [Armatimonadota bacterium]